MEKPYYQFTKANPMNRLISICLPLFIVVIGNAQVITKPKLNELNQDQLNLALVKSKKTIKTGKIVTFIGLGVTSIGVAILVSEAGKQVTDDNPGGNTASSGLNVAIIGGVTTWIGIPVWLAGLNRKKKIEIELVKFNPKGSVSINGIGLKIRF